MDPDLPKLKDVSVEEYEKLVFDIKYDKEQFKDPMTLGLLLYRLTREREATNHLFRKILGTLEAISARLEAVSSAPSPPQDQVRAVMSELDQRILTHAQQRGRIDAAGLQAALGYRGSNAASARLNALYQRGLLQKGRAGKKVWYWLRGAAVQAPGP